MIERVTAASGDTVLRVDGRLTASRVDPRAEARAWLDHRTALLNEVRSIFVLGLGSGYHVLELLSRTEARVIVIETRPEVLAAEVVALDPRRVRAEWGETVDAALRTDGVQEALRASYLVLTHPASRALDPEFYGALSERLVARTPRGLDHVWSLRGHAGLGEVIVPGNNPLTIYDLAQNEVIANCGERERALIKALRELVK